MDELFCPLVCSLQSAMFSQHFSGCQSFNFQAVIRRTTKNGKSGVFIAVSYSVTKTILTTKSINFGWMNCENILKEAVIEAWTVSSRKKHHHFNLCCKYNWKWLLSTFGCSFYEIEKNHSWDLKLKWIKSLIDELSLKWKRKTEHHEVNSSLTAKFFFEMVFFPWLMDILIEPKSMANTL